jgi:hypothetical protein
LIGSLAAARVESPAVVGELSLWIGARAATSAVRIVAGRASQLRFGAGRARLLPRWLQRVLRSDFEGAAFCASLGYLAAQRQRQREGAAAAGAPGDGIVAPLLALLLDH